MPAGTPSTNGSEKPGARAAHAAQAASERGWKLRQLIPIADRRAGQQAHVRTPRLSIGPQLAASPADKMKRIKWKEEIEKRMNKEAAIERERENSSRR